MHSFYISKVAVKISSCLVTRTPAVHKVQGSHVSTLTLLLRKMHFKNQLTTFLAFLKMSYPGKNED